MATMEAILDFRLVQFHFRPYSGHAMYKGKDFVPISIFIGEK